MQNRSSNQNPRPSPHSTRPFDERPPPQYRPVVVMRPQYYRGPPPPQFYQQPGQRPVYYQIRPGPYTPNAIPGNPAIYAGRPPPRPMIRPMNQINARPMRPINQIPVNQRPMIRPINGNPMARPIISPNQQRPLVYRPPGYIIRPLPPQYHQAIERRNTTQYTAPPRRHHPNRSVSLHSASPDTATELLSQAQSLYGSHHYPDAQEKWKQLLSQSLDGLTRARVLSNMASVSRISGDLESALQYVTESWECVEGYVGACTSTSWVYLVSTVFDIECKAVTRTSSVGSTSSTSSESLEKPGPPLVGAVLDLTLATANVHHCLGDIVQAKRYHGLNIRLIEGLFEEFPLPAGYETPLQHPARRKKGTSVKLSWIHSRAVRIHALVLSALALLDKDAAQASLARDLTGYLVPFVDARDLDACISANSGTVEFYCGRVTSALALHEHAAKVFNEVGDGAALAKERGNLGCIWLEIGKSLDCVAICNAFSAIENDYSPLVDYWSGSTHGVGGTLFEKAIIMVAGCLEKSVRLNDWMGSMTACINLAVCYTVSQQPSMALFHLARLVHLLDTTTYIPPYFEQATHYSLIQTLYTAHALNKEIDDPQYGDALLQTLGAEHVSVRHLDRETLVQLAVVALEKCINVRSSVGLKATLGKLDWIHVDSLADTCVDGFSFFNSGERWFWGCGGGDAFIDYLNQPDLPALMDSAKLDDDSNDTSIDPLLLLLGADLLGYVLHLCLSGTIDSFDLMGVLRITVAPGDDFESIRLRLLNSAKTRILDTLGFCQECFQVFSSWTGDLVPVSSTGAGSKFVKDPFGNGVVCFPCGHYGKG